MSGTLRSDPHRGLVVIDAGAPLAEARRHPGMPHTINEDEIRRLEEMLAGLVDG